MSNIFQNIPSYDPSDPEKLKVQKIEQDKQKEGWIAYENLLLSKEFILQATFFQLLKSYIERALEEKSKETAASALTTFRTLLNTLSKQNLSESSSFAFELSQNWLKLLHIKEPEASRFCQMVKDFSRGGDHSLGYYLTNYAGDQWLPFPFMELLKFLHEDALIQQEKSTLCKWSLTLTEIIDKVDT